MGRGRTGRAKRRSTEVCKCKFTKLVPGARAVILTYPWEVRGKQEPLNRIRAGGLWRARRGPRKTEASEDEEEMKDLTEENQGNEKGGKQRGKTEERENSRTGNKRKKGRERRRRRVRE